MGIDFVVVGPEVPLCNGAVDILSNLEFPLTDLINQQPALGSKAFTKDFWQNIKSTASTVIFKPVNRPLNIYQNVIAVVVKASGLAAGKGVIICNTVKKPTVQLKTCLKDRALEKAERKW